MNISEILSNTNPDDIRFLLQQYNITEEPTEESIAKAIMVFGDDFITDLYILTNYSANADGDIVLKERETPMSNFYDKNKFDEKALQKEMNKVKRSAFFNKLGAGLTSFSAQLKDGLKSYADAKNALTNNAGQNNTAEEKTDNTWKYALAIGGGIIIILVLFVVFRKKS